MRKFTLPTHTVFSAEQVNKIVASTRYAHAILTLIQNDSPNNECDEPEEFFTNTRNIKTAISAVQYFLEEIEENSKNGKLVRIEE